MYTLINKQWMSVYKLENNIVRDNKFPEDRFAIITPKICSVHTVHIGLE